MKPLLFMLVLSFVFSCSSGNGKQDAGDNGDGDATDAGYEPSTDGDAVDAGDPGDVDQRPDYDPSRSFLLIVPNGTSLCHGFCEGRSWRQALDMIGMIDLTSGYYVLPRQEGFRRAEMVDKITFSPQHNVLLPTAAAGEAQAEYFPWGNGEWLYTFRKSFTHQGEIYSLEVPLHIRNTSGIWPDEVTIEPTYATVLISAKLFIGAGQDPVSEIQTFGLCELPELAVYTATSASGDQVILDMRGGMGCQIAGETACLFLTSAQVQLGVFQQSVTDRMRLVYVGSHHNWYDEYLILLDPPDGNTHAVWVIAPPFMGGAGYVIKLDASFNEVSRDEITTWQEN